MFSTNPEVSNGYANLTPSKDKALSGYMKSDEYKAWDTGFQAEYDPAADAYHKANDAYWMNPTPANKVAKEAASDKLDMIQAKWQSLGDEAKQKFLAGVPPDTPTIYPAHVAMDNPYVVDMKGQGYDPLKYSMEAHSAKAKGHDGVIFKNVDDTIDGSGHIGDVHVVFDPNQIHFKLTGEPPIPGASTESAPHELQYELPLEGGKNPEPKVDMGVQPVGTGTQLPPVLADADQVRQWVHGYLTNGSWGALDPHLTNTGVGVNLGRLTQDEATQSSMIATDNVADRTPLPPRSFDQILADVQSMIRPESGITAQQWLESAAARLGDIAHIDREVLAPSATSTASLRRSSRTPSTAGRGQSMASPRLTSPMRRCVSGWRPCSTSTMPSRACPTRSARR
jgi:hypothetical protein